MDGERWGTAFTFSRNFGLMHITVQKRLAGCFSIFGKNHRSHRYAFYRESDARSACADLLDVSLHCTNPDGFIELHGERWGTLSVIASEVGTCRKSLLLRA